MLLTTERWKRMPAAGGRPIVARPARGYGQPAAPITMTYRSRSRRWRR